MDTSDPLNRPMIKKLLQELAMDGISIEDFITAWRKKWHLVWDKWMSQFSDN
ncbi:hypothetical protein LCGC14_1345990 [marine sediment metagenome]|uniref:Uncharacterized protein n=1 Tax=marine sediment metagenome TaxID=412755 RepID=A0A0F9KD01_9ZZZZ